MGDRASAETRLGDVVVSELGAALGRHDFAKLVSTDPAKRDWAGPFCFPVGLTAAQAKGSGPLSLAAFQLPSLSSQPGTSRHER